MREIPSSTEVLVIGGGPAGLASAIALRLAGRDVTLIERRAPPVDKACGEGIMPDGASLLSRLGIRFPDALSARFTGVRFVEGPIDAVGLFAGRTGLGVRRTVLNRALAERAAALGVRLLWGVASRKLHADRVEVEGGTIRAAWIVAADGQRSHARRHLGLEMPALRRRTGLRRHYRMPPWNDLVEVYWSNRCEAYVTPVAPDSVCVAILTDDTSLRFDEALRRFPPLASRLGGAHHEQADLGAPTAHARARRASCGRYALAGDAAGSVDAITGEGITLGLHQAFLLCEAIRRGNLELYDGACRRLMRRPRRMSSIMLAIDRRGWLRRATLRTLAARPALFGSIVTAHART